MTILNTLPKEFTGGCACREIRYLCTSAPLRMVNCYCIDCQKAGGTGYSPTVIVNRSDFIITVGSPKNYERTADSGNIATRTFCNKCGSPLFAFSSERTEYLGIRAGSLDDSSWFKPTKQVWTSSAQPWVTLADDLE